MSSGSIASAVLSAEDTWKTKTDVPYFDPRLIVDTSAQFVASSFRVRRVHGEANMITARSTSDAEPKAERRAIRRDVALLQVMVSHAHSYAGAERLMLELVPHCKALRAQLRQTVQPLCAESMTDQGQTLPGEHDAAIDYEVDRFLRSRLVTCDLAELLSHDVFADMSAEDDFLPGVKLGSMSARGDLGDREAEASDRRAETLAKDKPDPDSEQTYDFQKDEHLEVVVRRFELRFWRAFTHGLGRSLFGAQQVDLVDRFEAAAQDLYLRYQGELQMAMNSLVGWLPSWLSDSLFVAFTGLHSNTAVKQCSEKFTMLHHCIKTLVRSSGRYIFISTPSWYLPLVSWLPDLGRRERVRGTPAQSRLTMRPLWPAVVLEPDACVAAVDRAWGGHIPGRRGRLKLLDGVEYLSLWVLRMTLGCEELVARALEVIGDLAPALEDAYDELEHAGALGVGPDFMDAHAALVEAEAAAKAISSRAADRQRILARRRSAIVATGRRSSDVDKGTGHRRRSSLTRTGPMRVSLVAMPQARNSLPLMFTPLDAGVSAGPSASDGAGREGIVDQDGTAFLAQLHVGAQGSSSEIGACHLRRTIATSAGGDTEITWPLGQHNTLNGRIPIHDSPDLLPTALPQIVEAHFGEGAVAPTLSEPFTGATALLPGPGAKAASGALNAISGGTPGSGAIPNSFLRTTGSSRGGRRNAKLCALRLDTWSTAATRQLARSVSAPELPPPPNPAKELQAMSRAKAVMACGRSSRRKQRAASAPPAVDSSDFDAGEPRRSTAVVLALQAALRKELSLGRSESPLHLLWRSASRSEEQSQLRCLRLGLGVMLLFAAMRAPLPVLSQLPLHHFAVVEAGVAQEREMLPMPWVQIPDAIFLFGCMPIFHTVATERSARLPPVAASACYVGVPHAMLDEQLVRDVLMERPSMAAPRWRAGALLVLLSIGVAKAATLPNSRYLTESWFHQDHRSFFSLACTFRLLSGLESVRQWCDQFLERRSEAFGTSMEEFLPFLKDTSCLVRSLPAHLDWTALGEAAEERPLLIAPRVVLAPDEEEAARPEEAPVLGAESVTLERFAAWVGSMGPGRVVYSSPESSTADLYWRLPDAVLAICFVSTGVASLTGHDVTRLFRGAVGDPAWWGVPVVSLLVLGSKLSAGLESAIGVGSCAACAVFAEGQPIDNGGTVPEGGEVVVASPQCLWSLLGLLKPVVHSHRRMFEGEIMDGRRSPRAAARGRGPGPRFKGLPAGAGKNAGDWRARRLVAPKAQQLEINSDALRVLLEHNQAHTRRLTERVEELCGDTDVGLGSQASSPAGSPTPGETGSRPATFGTAGRPGQTASERRMQAGAKEAMEKAAAEESLVKLGDGLDEPQAPGTFATIDSRAESPVRTEKSQRWRPPTPHPTHKREHMSENRAEARLLLAALGRPDQEPPPFDFVGFGDWRTAILQHQKPGSRGGRTTQVFDAKA